MTIGPRYREQGYQVPGAGFPPASAGRAGMLVSHADRDQALELLTAAYAEGRLSKDEYDARMASAFAARTYADLDALAADLPSGQRAAPPRTDAMAIAALVCGLAEFLTLGLTAIPAVVLGHMARGRIRRTGDDGSGMATAGLTLGWIGVGMWVLTIAGLVIGAIALFGAPPHPGHVHPVG